MVRRMSVPRPHIERFIDRHGHERLYFRRGKGKRIPLPPIDDDGFEAAYRAAAQAIPPAEPKSVGGHHPRSLNALLHAYYASTKFRATKAISQATTRGVLDRIAKAHGHRLVTEMEREHVERVMAPYAATQGTANAMGRNLRKVLNYAIKLKWRADNPAHRFDAFNEGTRHTWTEAEQRQFEAFWPLGTRQRTLYALALYTAQRRADLARMTWASYDPSAQTITIAQQKGDGERNDEWLTIPVHPELKRALDAWPRQHIKILATAQASRMTDKSLGNFAGKAIRAAGLPKRCVLHGLRKASATALAEAGCTTHEIMAITGHKNLAEVERYTRKARQKGLAQAAIVKLGERKVDR